MNYLDPKWEEWYNVIGGPAVYKVIQTWQVYRSDYDVMYYAEEYEDGWFSVECEDGWIGEFPSREDAEKHMSLVFTATDVYDGAS